MIVKFKDGTEIKVATVKKNIDRTAFFNNQNNNTTITVNSGDTEFSIETLENILTPENVSEVTFMRSGGEDIIESYERFARITQNIDDYGSQIFIVLSKDPYISEPPEGAKA